MSIHEVTPLSPDEKNLWGLNIQPMGCSVCDQTYLVTSNYSGLCPNCAQSKLDPRSALQREEPPEMVIPFSIETNKLRQIYQAFTKDILFPVNTFTAEFLSRHTLRIYIPMWLVDSVVSGSWRCESGFDYQVKSSQEHYSGNRWVTSDVMETRVRWEPRLGEIRRKYNNIVIPALRNMGKITEAIGSFSIKNTNIFSSQQLTDSIIQVPDLNPNELIRKAEDSFESVAAKECNQACGAQHMRGFVMKANYEELNWTNLLLPVYVTHYLNEENQPQLVYVNGQTGQIYGPRYSSQNKGLKWAGIIGGIAAVLLIIALLSVLAAVLIPPLSVIGGVIGIAGLCVLVGAIFPAVYPMAHNSGQHRFPTQGYQKQSR